MHWYDLFWSMPVKYGILTPNRAGIKQLEYVQLHGFVVLSLIVLPFIGRHPHLNVALTYIVLPSYLVTVLSVYDILSHYHCLDFGEYFTLSSAPTRSHSLTICCK